MDIEVLGPGCPKCSSLEENVKKAVKELDLNANISKITDLNIMIDKGLMSSPGLIINGKLVMQGKSLSIEQVKQLIQKEMEK